MSECPNFESRSAIMFASQNIWLISYGIFWFSWKQTSSMILEIFHSIDIRPLSAWITIKLSPSIVRLLKLALIVLMLQPWWSMFDHSKPTQLWPLCSSNLVLHSRWLLNYCKEIHQNWFLWIWILRVLSNNIIFIIRGRRRPPKEIIFQQTNLISPFSSHSL